jgi:hypothetical protein
MKMRSKRKQIFIITHHGFNHLISFKTALHQKKFIYEMIIFFPH